jgi:hypothetical protein|tara:strand:+ start:593 stop:793 length:201 start_codon:yes stop_codon:yes gene_type:complete
MAFFKNFIEALKSKRVWASMITCFFLVMSSTVVPDVSQEKVLAVAGVVIALVLGDSVRATVPKVEE